MDDEILLSENCLSIGMKIFQIPSHRSTLTEQPNNRPMDHNVRIHVEVQKYLFVHRDFQ